MTKLIIDWDPGHDDAVAILLAARHVELLGITTVFGNQRVARTTENALRLLALGGLDVPVARAARRRWSSRRSTVPRRWVLPAWTAPGCRRRWPSPRRCTRSSS